MKDQMTYGAPINQAMPCWVNSDATRTAVALLDLTTWIREISAQAPGSS